MNNKEIEHKLTKIINKVKIDNKGIFQFDFNIEEYADIFKSYGILNSEQNRRIIQSAIFEKHLLKDVFNSVILNENILSSNLVFDTENDERLSDKLLNADFLIGIKMNSGYIKKDKGQFISNDMDLLKKKYKSKDYKHFQLSKWSSIFYISKYAPTMENLEANCRQIAKFARITQKFKKVPILEIIILSNNEIKLDYLENNIKLIYSHIFYHLNLKNIYIPGCILLLKFTGPQTNFETHEAHMSVIKSTLNVIKNSIPLGIPLILLSDKDLKPEVSLKLFSRTKKILDCGLDEKVSYGFCFSLIESIIENFNIDYELTLDYLRKFFKEGIDDLKKAIKGEYKHPKID